MFNNLSDKDLNYGWGVAAVLFVLAMSFVLDVWGDRKTIRTHPLVEKRFYSTDTVRDPFAKAETVSAGFRFHCNDCHAIMKPPAVSRKPIAAHEKIVLDHEQAMTCYTCHSRDDREMLNDIHGTKISFAESDQICRRCHGPRYRDWKMGIHGRPTGYWDKTKGESKNLTCVYCHNPHAPQFMPMPPSPMPRRDNFIMMTPSGGEGGAGRGGHLPKDAKTKSGHHE
jgi:hypothetical protein